MYEPVATAEQPVRDVRTWQMEGKCNDEVSTNTPSTRKRRRFGPFQPAFPLNGACYLFHQHRRFGTFAASLKLLTFS